MANNSTGFVKPSLKSLRDRAAGEINASTKGDSRLRYGVLPALKNCVAGATDEMLRYLDWIARQTKIQTADDEALDDFGETWDVPRKSASFATGKVTFPGTPGAIMPSGKELRRGDNVLYRTLTSAEADSQGNITIEVKAVTTGKDSNAAAGVKMKLTSPIEGINIEGIVDSKGITGGAERESNDRYYPRILKRIQRPSLGGALEDYETWALEVPGVTRAWAYSKEQGPGTVTVRVMMDDTYEDGIPREGDIDRISAYLNDEVRHPSGAEIFVVAPIVSTINVILTKLNPDKAEVRNAIRSNCRTFLAAVPEPGALIYISQLDDAINAAPDLISFTRISPSADIQLGGGEIPMLGEVEFR